MARALRASICRVGPDAGACGASYGSYVAEQFALTHPAQVGHLVLDSVVPSWNLNPLQLASMRQTATVLRAACAARRPRTHPMVACSSYQQRATQSRTGRSAIPRSLTSSTSWQLTRSRIPAPAEAAACLSRSLTITSITTMSERFRAHG